MPTGVSTEMFSTFIILRLFLLVLGVIVLSVADAVGQLDKANSMKPTKKNVRLNFLFIRSVNIVK